MWVCVDVCVGVCVRTRAHFCLRTGERPGQVPPTERGRDVHYKNGHSRSRHTPTSPRREERTSLLRGLHYVTRSRPATPDLPLAHRGRGTGLDLGSLTAVLLGSRKNKDKSHGVTHVLWFTCFSDSYERFGTPFHVE